jgi:hypothetical protein
MSWKDIVKAHCGTEKMGKPCNCEECVNKKLTPKQSKHLDRNKDGKISREDFDLLNKGELAKVEKLILAEIKKEGGALGMKNLKSIADTKTLKRAIDGLVRRKKIYIHTDGDIYTHKPSSKRRGPFTA